MVSVTHLKDWGLLKPNTHKRTVLTFSRGGMETGKIAITVKVTEDYSFIEFDYSFNGQPILYQVELVKIASNLSKGDLWYFVCPKTYKLCRKLYLIGNKFLHREAYPGIMYESQIQSKKSRELGKLFELIFASDHIYPQLYKRYFKTHYAGRPTKRYVKIMNILKRAERCNITQEQLLLM